MKVSMSDTERVSGVTPAKLSVAVFGLVAVFSAFFCYLTMRPVPSGSFASVQRIFRNECASCHGREEQYASWGVPKKGPLIKRGDPKGSRLSIVIHSKLSDRMPPNRSLSKQEIESIDLWITNGAKED